MFSVIELYIDPGTGSMLFSILIALLGTLAYFFRNLFVKLRHRTGGRLASEALNQKDSENLVIYVDDKRYWNVFEPICDELERLEIKALYLTGSEDDPALKKSYHFIQSEFLGEGNKAFARMNFLKAKIVLSTTPSLDVYQWKRSKYVEHYVHIPHAASDITVYRMFGIDYYDAILLSGNYQAKQIRRLEKLRNLPAKQLELVGIPYMDALKARLLADNNTVKKQEPVILLAPSWGPNSILNRYGERFIEALIASNYSIIIRPHPQSFSSERELLDRLMKKFPENEKLRWNQDTDNYHVLREADLMISDFSGVIFDFTLVFDKPIIYADTSFDKSPYDCWWLEEELWTFEALPRLGAKLEASDIDSIKTLIDTCIGSDLYKKNRERLRQETWVHEGEGARRVVKYLERYLNDSSTITVEKIRKVENT